MNCKVKQGCLTSESCCILLWLAFTLFPVSVVTAADNRKIDESQQKEVKAEMKGYVGDENGEPVIGATVLESGTQNGVITDVDGIFTIQLAKNASLTISYVGYQKKTVVVKDKKFISVNLTPDRSMMLDEVVVVGFGKQKKESLVGAVQAVKPEDLKMTSSNLSTSFAGNVPGIIAVQTQGEPGSDEAKFYIRGISTFGSNTSPLIILDGVEINATMMNNIPPESIASFSVLKDATATSLYGSRGANGVIIVTTKQGQLSEKMSVDIRFDNTFSMPTYVQKMADGPTYMDMYNEAVYNQAIANNQEYEPFYSRDKIDKTRANANPYLFPNNDWYSMLFKDFAVNQNLNISIKGGSKNVDYFLNAGIFYENGIIRQPKEDKLDVGMRNKKYLFQSNVTARVTSTTKVGLNMNTQLFYHHAPKTSTRNLFAYSMHGNPVRFPATLPAEPGDTYIRYGSGMWENQSRILTPN